MGRNNLKLTLPDLDALVQRLLALATAPAPFDFLTLQHCFGVIDAWVATAPCHASPETALPSLSPPGALESLHRLRGRYEAWLELAQAQQLLACTSGAHGLREYVQKHWPQTAIHSQAFMRHVCGKQSCLLVGCGALPSTALLLMEHTSLRVTSMDRLPQSCLWAQKVLSMSGHPLDPVLCEDAASRTHFDEWDVIFVAALAGVSEAGQAGSRHTLIQHLLRHAAPGTLICLRSANGWGRLIYPTVALEQLSGFDVDVIHAPVVGRSDLVLATARSHCTAKHPTQP
jgi:Nicotianamine synthase protein